MQKGITIKYTHPKILTEMLISQIQLLLKNKSYINKKITINLGYNFNSHSGNILVPHTERLLEFLKNVYKCTNYMEQHKFL